MRYTVIISLVFCSFLVSPGLAQWEPDAAQHDLLDRIEMQVALGWDPGERFREWQELEPEVGEAAKQEPAIALLAAIMRIGTGGEAAADVAIRATQCAQVDAVEPCDLDPRDLLSSLGILSATSRPSEADLYRLGAQIERLQAAGVGLSGLLGNDAPPALLSLIEQAAKAFNAGRSGAGFLEGREADRERFIASILSISGNAIGPSASGVVGVAFTDALEWNGQLWDATSDGVDLVADGIGRGELDMNAYRAVADRIETLATQGPWGAGTAADMFKKLVTQLPVLGKIIGALWPVSEPEACQAINCDCDNNGWGILAGPMAEECRAVEAALRDECLLSATVTGTCHPTASGPDAFP